MASFLGKLFGSQSSVQQNPAEVEAEVNEIWAGLTKDQRQSIYNFAKHDTRLPEKFRYFLEYQHEHKYIKSGERGGLADWVLEMDLSRMIQSFYIDGVSIPIKYKENPAEKALIYSIFREKLVNAYADRIKYLKRLNEITNRDGSEGHAKLAFKDIKGISDELLEARVDFLKEEKRKAGAAWGLVPQPGKSNRRKSHKNRK